MLDDDEAFFVWVRDDGVESVIHWNKWAVWRGAMIDHDR
jgi:hypothetical protein